MFSLFIRNLIFTILQPGIVAGLVPYLILGDEVKDTFAQQFQFYNYAGAIIFAIGFVIMVNCIISFAVNGRGTLSPAFPTKKLVSTGLYTYTRNPMYVGVMLIMIGEAIFFRSTQLWIYLFFVFAAFNIFIIRFEEPRLRKDFGEEYTRYCEKAKRWI